MRPGPVELFIILSIIIVLFGVGRISKIGSELGGAVSNFRKAVSTGEKAHSEES